MPVPPQANLIYRIKEPEQYRSGIPIHCTLFHGLRLKN
jgi:hypothetical protein